MESPARFVIDATIRERPLDDEIVLYHPGTDAVSRLDRVGALAWRELREPVSAAELTDRLAGHFDLPAAEIANDINTLLDSLVDAGLIHERQ